jgi:Protein of unknown function (DUF2867)
MKKSITPIAVPNTSAINQHLQGSYFHDCYELSVQSMAPSALEIYLGVVSQTPRWINGLMAVRNRIVAAFGLKDLGNLGAIDSYKPAHAYRVGDRVGIFSLLQLSDNEIILGDSDKHLDAKVSVCKLSANQHNAVAVTTVVHVHNALGRAYLFFVIPVHKFIVPAMLSRVRS